MIGNLISVLVVDGDPSFRRTVRDLIGKTDDITLAGTAKSPGKAIELARTLMPDVILLDADIQGANGLEPVQEIGQASPGSRIIILGASEQENLVLNALRKGAWGHLVRGKDTDEILQAIRVVSRGGTLLSPRVAGQVLDEVVRSRRHRARSGS